MKIYEFTIPSGQQASNVVPVKILGQDTRLIDINIPAGAPAGDLTVLTGLFGEARVPVLATADTEGDPFTVALGATGGSPTADVLAPLANQVDKDWQLNFSVAVPADLVITVRIL